MFEENTIHLVAVTGVYAIGPSLVGGWAWRRLSLGQLQVVSATVGSAPPNVPPVRAPKGLGWVQAHALLRSTLGFGAGVWVMRRGA